MELVSNPFNWGYITSEFKSDDPMQIFHPDSSVENLPTTRQIGETDKEYEAKQEIARRLYDRVFTSKNNEISNVPFMANSAFRLSERDFLTLRAMLAPFCKYTIPQQKTNFSFVNIIIKDSEPEDVLKVVSVGKVARIFKTVKERNQFTADGAKRNEKGPEFYIVPLHDYGEGINWYSLYEYFLCPAKDYSKLGSNPF